MPRSKEEITLELQEAARTMVRNVERQAELGLEMAQVLGAEISDLPGEIGTGGFNPGVMDAADASMAKANAILTRAVAHIAQCIGNERIQFVLTLNECEDVSIDSFAKGQDCGYAQLAERLVAERRSVVEARRARDTRELEEQGEAWWDNPAHMEADDDEDYGWATRAGTWGEY